MTERDWRPFVLQYGWRARLQHLAHILAVSTDTIASVRRTGAVQRGRSRDFGELFALWHGRPPRDDEWPAPVLGGGNGYMWERPELALLARLVGTVPVTEIAAILTTRLRALTGDLDAARNVQAVRGALNQKLGLQSGVDLVGGLTTREATQRVGRLAVINQAIYNGQLKTFRVGKRHVIPRAEFERWLATREEPPVGWVRLASLMKPLGIASDSKLPEYAALGYIPDVVKVQGIGTARGTWYIAPARAAQILEDARAGRPRPWYGKPLPGNVRAMWAKWRRRRHRRCRQCIAIWRGPAPSHFEDFSARYPTLTLGQKRHLTLDRTCRRRGSVGWRPRGSVIGRMRDAGMTVYEAARELQQPSRWIRGYIRMGLFDAGGLVRDEKGGEPLRITPLGLCILRAAAADEAARADSREWLGVHLAAQHAGVCIMTAHRWRRTNEVITKDGPRGILFERASVEQRARAYWIWALKRFRRAIPPTWLLASEAA